MKKTILTIILVFLMTLTSVNALTLTLDQTDNLQEFTNKDKGNTFFDDFAGSTSTSLSQTIEITNSNNSYPYDYQYEFSSIAEDFYIAIQNVAPNSNLTIMWHGDLGRNSVFNVQEVTMLESGAYYYRFSPEYDGEPGRIYFEFSDSTAGFIQYVEEKPLGFNDLIGGIVGAAEDFVNIQISLWTVAYYTVILIVAISFIGGLFWSGAWVIKNGRDFRESNKRRI